ncbi:hypothetical protein GXW82_26825 [Streptacidiphilus sp. 4-A2]|nr:hypothetical protein [Streptacidiphilus sp. 4-A2]
MAETYRSITPATWHRAVDLRRRGFTGSWQFHPDLTIHGYGAAHVHHRLRRRSQAGRPREGIAADPTVALAAAAAAAATATVTTTAAPAGAGEGEENVPPALRPWVPRPHSQLSPEDKDPADLTDEELEALTSETSKGAVGGAFAIVGAALGLASVTGTWLGTMVYQRQQLIGSLATSGKSNAQQFAAEYTSPWHKVAEFNGIFAIAAVVIGIAVLLFGRFLTMKPMPGWARAIAWAALGLGLVGLLISGAMYFDWFTHTINVPAASTSGATGS